MGPSKYVIVLLTFVTIGMAAGALLQLAFLKRLEESSGSGIHINRKDESEFDNQTIASGLSLWQNDEGARTLRVGLVKQEIISWQPRIILLHNFLSADECDHLIDLARPRLMKSTVVDANTGKGIESKVRTSTGMFLNSNDRKHHTIQDIETRIAAYSMVPVENGELLQVLRYESEQYYKAHHDYFSDEFNLKRGGQRVATMLMYLTEGVEGGETIFPGAGEKECSCGGEMRRGVCVKPKRGDAVLFWSIKLDGAVDPSSLHGGCKVLSGEKWSSTKWMRQRAFD
ncbi:hypothetical protein M758_3G185000 [Ceratodon purpureus]|uniref:Fe2OG dioxygenase domain-containing protein n=1 Tax=Ceratodon purpureus TaxID=3225 RepID=A0A8T0ILH3_CERPU|nr:hypothetical protein KC19_3G184900 [Ceratodon purpureus]KAG0623581.1 hypothetical protein M758_3G185000 [Ceratodon purpureus]